MNRRRDLRALSAAIVMMLVAGPAAVAGGLVFVGQANLQGDTRVVDVRDSQACTKGSLAGARCLPVAEVFDDNGRPADFRALRWLFGTVGLGGHERVLVVGDDVANAAAVGALLFLSGQADVAVLDGPIVIPAGAPGGSSRSLTREEVFTAPMRDEFMTVGAADDGVVATEEPIGRLSDFARRYADGNGSLQLSLAP